MPFLSFLAVVLDRLLSLERGAADDLCSGTNRYIQVSVPENKLRCRDTAVRLNFCAQRTRGYCDSRPGVKYTTCAGCKSVSCLNSFPSSTCLLYAIPIPIHFPRQTASDRKKSYPIDVKGPCLVVDSLDLLLHGDSYLRSAAPPAYR
ncbi:unnamed protein product [Scytosiphon promiscuus]